MLGICPAVQWHLSRFGRLSVRHLKRNRLIVSGALVCAMLLAVTAVQWRQGALLSEAVLRSGDDAANSSKLGALAHHRGQSFAA